MGRVSSIGRRTGLDSLFPDASLKETPENRKLRFTISELLAQARQRKGEGLIEHYVHFKHELTTGQAVKLRDNNCRLWMRDGDDLPWYYHDFIDGKLVLVYEEGISNECSSDV